MMDTDWIDRTRQGRVGGGAYAAGVLAATSIAGAAHIVDVLGSGNPDAVFAIPILCMLLLPTWGFYMAAGWLPFDWIRRLSPTGYFRCLAFILFILAPIIETVCILASLLFGYLFDSAPHAESVTAHGSGLLALANDHWMLLAYINTVAGMTCWSINQCSTLWLSDRSLRLKAIGALAATLAVSTLPWILFLTANQYLVAYQAQRAAGSRPYCILVPSLGHYQYVMPTRLRQFSPFNMQAVYQSTTGSRGGWWATNHALLIMDDPREILNWSYRSETFRPDALLNMVRYDVAGNKKLTSLPCVPVVNFTATLR